MEKLVTNKAKKKVTEVAQQLVIVANPSKPQSREDSSLSGEVWKTRRVNILLRRKQKKILVYDFEDIDPW